MPLKLLQRAMDLQRNGQETREEGGAGLDEALQIAQIQSQSKYQGLHSSQWSCHVRRIVNIHSVKQIVNEPSKTCNIHIEWANTQWGREICTSGHWQGDDTRIKEIPGGWVISMDSPESQKGYFPQHCSSLVVSQRVPWHAIQKKHYTMMGMIDLMFWIIDRSSYHYTTLPLPLIILRSHLHSSSTKWQMKSERE